MAKRKLRGILQRLRSKFGCPAIVGQATDISRALRVGKSQIREANDFAQSVGCGAPFRTKDGNFEGTRSQKKKYMQEINRRRVDQGEPRFVNLDGGYGDEI
jgi:hypothetical protein